MPDLFALISLTMLVGLAVAYTLGFERLKGKHP